MIIISVAAFLIRRATASQINKLGLRSKHKERARARVLFLAVAALLASQRPGSEGVNRASAAKTKISARAPRQTKRKGARPPQPGRYYY